MVEVAHHFFITICAAATAAEWRFIMMRSMFSGVSGLRAHQTRMDVIGNNVANVNTVGFKSGRVTFSEVFSQTMKGASSPDAASGRGGSNPMQVGLGIGGWRWLLFLHPVRVVQGVLCSGDTGKKHQPRSNAPAGKMGSSHGWSAHWFPGQAQKSRPEATPWMHRRRAHAAHRLVRGSGALGAGSDCGARSWVGSAPAQ